MQEKGETLDPIQKDQTQKLRDELKTALDNNDIETLKSRLHELEQAAAYMQGAQGGSTSASGQASDSTPGTNPDDVVDADFTKKDNNDGGNSAA